MYNKLSITENTLRVLSLFTNGFDREYYIREIKKLLNISPRTAQLILEDLEDKGILESKKRGKIKTFKLSTNYITKKYIILAEQYKSISFLENKPMIKEIIEKITPLIDGIGVIFGSYVKGIEKENSDLDIFVVGKYNSKEIKKISRRLGVDISVKCYPPKSFENVYQDIFLKEILKNHIIFNEIETFVSVILHV